MPSTPIQTHTAAKINCKLQVNSCFRLALHNWHCHWFPKRREPWCTMGQQKQHQGRGSESTVAYLPPPFSAPVSGQRDTAVWLGDKKRIIVVRLWRNNIGPVQPIWVQDNYFLIVYTNLFCFVLCHVQNTHKERIAVVEIVKTPNVQLPTVVCAPNSGLREFSVCFRCCCVDMTNSLNIIRRILFITAQNL